MQTAGDVLGQVTSLTGDMDHEYLEPDYFYPKLNTAYQNAINYLKGSCSPYIEKVIIIPGVPVGVDPSDLVPYNTATGGATALYPLDGLMEPRYVDYKLPGTHANQFRPAKEFRIMPDSVQQVTAQTYDIRVRGDFLPSPLVNESSRIELYPNCAHALAYSVMVLIGAEKPNEAWTEQFLPLAQSAWDLILADLVRQQQRLSFRLGAPNRQGRSGWGFYPYSLQGCVGWEWTSFQLNVKMV